MRNGTVRIAALLFLAVAGSAIAGQGAVEPANGTAAPDLYQVGKELFDEYAPAEVKEQYDFPSRQEFDKFLARLQQALDGGSLEELAGYEPQARAALVTLRAVPAYSDYANWLAARLEEIDEARLIAAEERARGPNRPSVPSPGGRGPPSEGESKKPSIPYYDAWLKRLRNRPMPANAAELMPRLRSAFSVEGVPPELAWLAEVESSFDPSARSPAGAKGLFQLKADTAHDLGLSTFLPDQRTDPDKSARAAARHLRMLKQKFGSWPLALAAYNAGEGRVSRALSASGGRDFAGIDSALSAETRMYVPEVLALVAVRTGTTLK